MRYILEMTEREKLLLSYAIWRFMNESYTQLELASRTKLVKSGHRNIEAEMITEKEAFRMDSEDAEKLVGKIRGLEPKND